MMWIKTLYDKVTQTYASMRWLLDEKNKAPKDHPNWFEVKRDIQAFPAYNAMLDKYMLNAYATDDPECELDDLISKYEYDLQDPKCYKEWDDIRIKWALTKKKREELSMILEMFTDISNALEDAKENKIEVYTTLSTFEEK